MACQCYIADDDVLIRTLYADIFQEHGYQVQTFADGAGLVDACRCKLPDLIIVDVYMPAMNGLDACREIRRLPGGRKVLIIISSGDPAVMKKENFHGCGESKFIRKPIPPKCLGLIADVIMA